MSDQIEEVSEALEGNFFAEAADVAMADPTAESYTRKQNFESTGCGTGSAFESTTPNQVEEK